jgi:antitoxin FitA
MMDSSRPQAWRQNGATEARIHFMPSIQIKAVPGDVHVELRRRAENAGKSLQEFLLGYLIEEARHRPLDDMLDRIDCHKGGYLPFRCAGERVREDRDAG